MTFWSKIYGNRLDVSEQPEQPGRVCEPPRTVGVLICTYKRPDTVLRGLAALATQHRRPDDVMVVARESDEATQQALATRAPPNLPLRVLLVAQPGTVHALNTGLQACNTDVLAITDDDTEPRPEWLLRILAHFVADPALGGLGGRDWVHENGQVDDRSQPVVGILQWFGRQIGNHHLGVGRPRAVHFLKGANMSYRAAAFARLRVDERLRGQGAQPFEDYGFSIDVRLAGWTLLYDPAVALDHYPGTRDQPRAYTNAANASVVHVEEFGFNEMLTIWRALPRASRPVYLLWSVLVGTGASPGLLQALRHTPGLRWRAWRRFAAVQRGKAQAVWLLARREVRPGHADASGRG